MSRWVPDKLKTKGKPPSATKGFGIGAQASATIADVVKSLIGGDGVSLPEDDGGAAEWLNMALATMGGGGGGGGGGGSYTAPYDEAAGRAQESLDAALPRIAGAYDDLRGQLGQQNQAYQQSAAQTQGNQAAAAASQQQLLAGMQAPVLADLQAQGGNAAVGSLTGGLQAQMMADQANLGQGAAAQQQFSQNLQAGGQQAFDSRIADSRMAETNAAEGARGNLNDLLNQIGIQRAAAARQQASDSASSGSDGSQLALKALEMKQAAQDPLRLMEIERGKLELDQLRKEAAGPDPKLKDFQVNLANNFPDSYGLLSSLWAEAENLPQVISQLRGAAKDGKVEVRPGKKLDLNALIGWATEYDRLNGN